MSKIIETKLNEFIELYTKDSLTSLVKRVVKFSPDGGGFIIGSAGVLGAAGTEIDNIKFHRGERGLQVLPGNDTTPDGVTSPNYLNIMGVSDRINAQYPAIVGSTLDVAYRTATHSSLQAAISSSSSGAQILVLDTYSTVENISLTIRVSIIGKGYDSKVNGTFTFFNSTASKSIIKFINFRDSIIINDGCNNNIITDCWIANGKIVTDNNTNPNQLISILEEE
jgi:hypothetical protein